MPDTALERKPGSSNLGNEDQDEDLFLLEDSSLGKFFFILEHDSLFLFIYGMLYFCWFFMSFLICCTDEPWEWSRFLKYTIPPLSIPALSSIFTYVTFFWLDEALIPKSVLIHLLKEVEVQSSRHSHLNWCQIAYSVNEFTREVDGSAPPYFSGDHCMKHFRKFIAGAVQSGRYKVGSEYSGPAFGSEKSQRDLLERSVDSYQRITEAFQKV